MTTRNTGRIIDLVFMHSKVRISKIDVAKDELTAALEFFMDYKHPIAVHTLAFAAHTILSDVAHGTKQGTTIYHMIKPTVSKKRRSELINRINASYTYFKHARSDFDKQHEFNPDQTEWVLMWTINLFQEIAGYKTPLMACFVLWMCKEHPEISFGPFDDFLKTSSLPNVQTRDRRAYKDLEPLFPSV